LLSETRTQSFYSTINFAGYLNVQYWPLLQAIYDVNWDGANHFLSLNNDAKSARISRNGGTVLHEAVFLRLTEIVEKLVDLMSAEELEIKDENGSTALADAASLQNTRMVDCMVRKNSNLLNIPNNLGCIPLVTTLQFGNPKWARRLYSVSLPQTLSFNDASMALSLFIYRNNFGKEARSNYFFFFILMFWNIE
jgi:hypothetical protein